MMLLDGQFLEPSGGPGRIRTKTRCLDSGWFSDGELCTPGSLWEVCVCVLCLCLLLLLVEVLVWPLFHRPGRLGD